MSEKCTNLGCGRQFSPEDLDDECEYHSGQPFFHDAYKGWTCCQQKSTDFTTFLNFKPCRRGRHSTEKRAEPKEEPKEEPPKEESQEQEEEEPEDEAWTELEVREASNCGQQEAKREQTLKCRKCGKTEAKGACVYHVGQTIFHETLKYWTCCPKKKFTDFEDFQELRGCREDAHHEMHVPQQKPRLDFFQTANQINLIVYGLKGARAHRSRVRTDGTRLEAEFRDAEGVALYEDGWELWGAVVKGGSVVRVEKNKVEISLKKRRNGLWTELSRK